MDSSAIKTLIHKSQDAMSRAYCPYSNFPVGAAILTSDGSIFQGCNVENAAYTIGICAERVAAVKAVSEGKMDFIAVAISSRISNDFIGPCGACRQFLVEFNPDIKVFLTKPDGSYKDTSMRELLPMTFTAEQLFSVTKDGLKKENSK